MRLSKSFLTTLLFCGFSLTALAHEAPVVDASQQQQQDAAVSTQAESSTGGSWQPVSSDSASASSPSAWQPVNAQAANSNAQPADEAQLSNNANSQAPIPVQEEVTAPSSHASGAVDQRVARLEQQISNYNQMNLPQQVTDLQQKNAELQGQLEVAQHNLKTLTDQQKLYYQDLEQQVAQLEKQKNVKTTLADNSNSSSDNNSGKNSDKSDASTSASSDSSSGFVEKNSKLTSGTSNENSASNNDQLNQATQVAPVNLLDKKKEKIPSLSDADSYGKAFRSLSDKHFDSAQKEFHEYLGDYPRGRFAVNAHFWLGEIALMHEKYDVATKQFQTVVAQYPTSSKVPDAKLKIAMINAAKGKMNLARTEFTQIRKLYPGSTAAQLASIRLQQLANATSTAST